jgi:hypothetical protein
MNLFTTQVRKVFLVVTALVLMVGLAAAQSGHFVGTPTCRDIGTQLSCTAKVAGLGGTTFEVRLSVSDAIASVICRNPGGNVVPGKSFDFDAVGTSGALPTPKNGAAKVTVKTTVPSAPADSCPNSQWTAIITDVDFSGATATLTLVEGTTVTDTVQVQIP